MNGKISKLVAGGLTLATVLTIGILANSKHGETTPADASGGCAFMVTAYTPPQGIGFVSMTISNWGGGPIQGPYTSPGDVALDTANADITIVWSGCPSNNVIAGSVTNAYCLYPPAQAGKNLYMYEGESATIWEVSATCSQGCPIMTGQVGWQSNCGSPASPVRH